MDSKRSSRGSHAYQRVSTQPEDFDLPFDPKKVILRVALPHVSLLIISICYAMFGSWAITVIKFTQESPEADFEELERLKRAYTVNLATGGRDQAFQEFSIAVHKVYTRLPLPTDALSQEFAQKNASHAWLRRFRWNLLFSATTLTSIGYGNDAPTSWIGRLFCLVFLVFGIPLYLITLADTAKFCTELLNRLYMEYMKKYILVKRRIRRWQSGRKRRDSVIINNVIIAGGEEEVVERV